MSAYTEDLDRLAAQGCAVPNCKHEHDGTVYIHGRCHINARMEVSYSTGTGLLRITCSECEQLVMEVAVASKVAGLAE